MGVLAAQSCQTLWDPMDCNPPDSSDHEILQARILEWVAISFSRESSWPGIKPGSPELQADSLPFEPPGDTRVPYGVKENLNLNLFWEAKSSESQVSMTTKVY